LASSTTFWLAHDRGRWTRVPGRSTHTASPDAAISPSHWRSFSRVVMNVPSGWQYPMAANSASSRSMLSPTSVLEIPTARPARRYDNPSNTTAAWHPDEPPRAAAGCRHGRVGGVAAGGPGRRPARPAHLRAAVNAGSMTTGTRPPGKRENLPMVWSPSMSERTEHHGHPHYARQVTSDPEHDQEVTAFLPLCGVSASCHVGISSLPTVPPVVSTVSAVVSTVLTATHSVRYNGCRSDHGCRPCNGTPNHTSSTDSTPA
jgi:hypothetical protein